MRGVAALYVVLYHVRILLEPGFASFGPTADLLPFRGQFLLYGHFAVGVFIVISGYVLTLPVAVRGVLAGGRRRFLMRRARRLLPAYYAALTLAVPLWILRSRIDHKPLTFPTVALQYFSHVLLIHDFNAHTIWGIDSPLWSVAVEVQIYLVFIVLLLPIALRWNLLLSVLVAFVLGYVPTIVGAVLHETPYPLSHACFWFLGLFALGSVVAFVAYDKDDRFAALRLKVPWKAISICATAAFVLLALPLYDDPQELSYRVDPILGIALASGFLAIAKDQSAGRRSLVATVLAWRPLVYLGSFSYSLYLIHDPILLPVMHYLGGLKPWFRLSIAYVALVPAVVVASLGFARVFEFPFVSTARRRSDVANSY